MAVFTPGISPYSYAEDNPINNIDFYGLGKEEREKRRRERHLRRENKRRERERNRQSRERDKNQGYASHWGGDGYTPYVPKSETNPGTPPNDLALLPSGEEIGPIDIKIPDPIPLSRSLTTPSFPIPKAGEKISFSKEIYFQSSSDRLYDLPANDKVLSDLVKTLQDYSQVTIFIFGNVHVTGGIPGHDEDALTQEVRYNGQWRTANDLMVGRARAVYIYLISKGIDPKRLNYGTGNVYTSPEGNMKKTSFIVRNP